MKKFSVFFLLVLIFSINIINAFSQPVSSRTIQKYVGYLQSANVTQSDFTGMELPKIAGTWYYVDGKDGNDARTGLDKEHALLTLAVAYGKCTSGRGDGIVILSRTVSGTSYSITQTARLLWTKYGITVYGVAAPTAYFGRARITHTSAADSLASLIYITGNNNHFINLNFYNSPENDGDPVSATAIVSAIQLGGVRNVFTNCHIYCAPQSANAYKTDIEMRANSDECVFNNCSFGSSSYDAGNNAACWIYYGSTSAQRWYNGCTFLQQASSGTAFGAVENGGATYLNGIDMFNDCTFAVWRANTHAAISASWFIGTKPNTGNIIMRDCAVFGFTALDAVGGNDCVWTNQPAGNAAGGIGVAP